MSWFLPFAGLEKKICRYLLQRYLGQFLEEKLNLDQLNIDLYQGKGTVKDVALNCESLNELCENQGWGVEVIGGHVGSVAITVPWSAPMTEDSSIEVHDLSVSLRPVFRPNDGSLMLESMWSSMSSSMQLAQECLQKDSDESFLNVQSTSIEGLEKFAQTIDSVLNRVKAKLFNTEIRIEYKFPDQQNGIAIIIKIDYLDYQNEAGNDPLDITTEDIDYSDKQKTHFLSTYATHHIAMEGITFYTEEFRIGSDKEREVPTSDVTNSSFLSSQQFHSVISDLSQTELFTVSNQKTHKISSASADKTSKTEADQNDAEPDITYYQNKKIQIAHFVGRQDIRIKLKQCEIVNGPKVSLDLQFSAVNLFLSPRQLHLILKYYEVCFKNKEELSDKKDVEIKNESNFEKFKKKQQNRLSSNMSGNIGNIGGWSLDPTQDNMYSFAGSSTKYSSSVKSGFVNESKNNFEYADSVSSSMTTSTSTSCSSKYQRKSANLSDSNGSISTFNIRIASVTAVLLHEDVLIENSILLCSPPLSEESVLQLENVSNFYFKSMIEEDINSFQCNKNYLQIICSPVILDGEQQRNNSNNILKLKCSLTRVEILEILENKRSFLIEFIRDDICNEGYHKRPEITINLKSHTPTLQNPKGNKPSFKTNLNLNLESCKVDFDISIIDRLSAVFNGNPFKIENEKNKNKKHYENSTSPNMQKQASFEINVDSPRLNFQLRFPIVDSRPIHDPNRTPWWKKNIRPDFLLFDFLQFRLKNTLTLIEICSNEVNLYYCESSNGPNIHIGKSTLLSNSYDELEYPKISIEFPSDKTLNSILKHTIYDSDSGETSGESCKYYYRKNREPLPFSSKRVCRQSDTIHAKSEYDDTETILLPGETTEMRNFCEKAMKTSKLQFRIFLPVASVQVNSKMLYELIYNRLNSDLLMWEPTAPGSKKSPKPKEAKPPNVNRQQKIDEMLWSCGMSESLYIPSSSNINQEKNDNIIDDSNSSSTNNDESEGESSSVYYSTYESRSRSKKSDKTPSLALSDCSFELIAKEAQCTFYTPVRDSENRVIPGQSGEFVINVENFNLFSVSGFNGNENLAYLCIQSKALKLYHCGLTPTLKGDPILRLINTVLPNHLLPTFYPTPNNSTLSSSKGVETREMISFAIEIKKVPQNRIKRLRITAGIQNTTLKYNPATSQHTWLNQLIDLFDVVDYPIQGYVPYHVVTEIQLHLWDCTIDYRPLHFPYRAIVEMGNFMLSSNIISSVPGCTLRFIAEDCVLSLAQYDAKHHQNISKHGIPFVSSKNLIPVVDVGLVDISLRLNDKNSDLLPKFDLRTSIQDLHIRTCSDSGKVFAQLISYIATDGDLNTTEDSSCDEANSANKENSADLLLGEEVLPSASEISSKQQERINALMAEALQETVCLNCASMKTEDKPKTDKGVELFFFPDETNQHILKNKDNLLQGEDTKSIEVEVGSSTSDKDIASNPENYSSVSRSSSEEWRFCKTRRESESSNELRDIINFETSVMSMSYMAEDEAVEASPQVKEDLGEIPCKVSTKDVSSHSRRSSISLDDDFYFVAEEERALLTKCGHENVKVSSDPLRIVDNHFTLPSGKPDLLKAPEGFPVAQARYTLCEMTVTWHLYGGNDFLTDDEKSNEETKDKENWRPRKYEMSEAYKMGVSFSKGRQTVHFDSKKPISKLNWKTKGGPDRKQDVLVEIQLTKMRLSHEIYPKNTSQASRQVLIVSEMEIRDRLQTSEINKFLYHPTAKNLSNKSSQHMIVVKALHVRPNLHKPTMQECSLRISLLPLRLNIDQDTLLFLVQFFNELSSNESDDNESNNLKKSSLQLQEPIMMVDDVPESLQDLQARKMVSTNLELLMEEDSNKSSKKQDAATIASDGEKAKKNEENIPTYFREIVFSPQVMIRLDYHGRRIVFSKGPIAGLLMGLGQLQCSEIKLKKIVYRHGILGADKLLNYLFKEWLQDIKRNQLPNILSGVGPMYTLVQLFQGIRDLFWLPIEQYQKDGRIVRGLQLGAQSFTARTALAALEITSRIIHLLQITAETAFDLVSPGPSLRRGRYNRKCKRKRPHRPQDIREGVANAYQIVKDGINETAQNLIDNTVAEHDQKGYTGAVGAVFRQIPPMVVCPVVLATQATTNVLGGVKNQLVPDARLEAKEKWKDDAD